MSPFNGYVYIAVVNIISTLIATYGLTLLRAALRPELERQFSVTGKILSLQLTLLCSAIPNIIIGILVATGVIPCNSLFPSKARGEAINYGFLILIMLPFSLIGRYFYRRKSDGSGCAGEPLQHMEKLGELSMDEPRVIEMTSLADNDTADTNDNSVIDSVKKPHNTPRWDI